MLKDNHHSSPQSSKLTIQRSTRNRNSPKRIMDQQSRAVKSRAKVKLSSLVTYINDSSISVMTIETSVKKSRIEFTKSSVVMKKKRRKGVLTNISINKKRNKQKMIQVMKKNIKKIRNVIMMIVNSVT